MRRRSLPLVIAACLLAWIAIPAAARDATPTDFGLAAPVPAPALPAGFDAYTPPLPLVSPLAPAVAEATRTAGPDDVVVMSGAGFDDTTEFSVYSQIMPGPGGITPATPLVRQGWRAAVLLPTQILPWSMYLIVPHTDGRVGRPVAINRTDAWWAGPQPAAPGDTVSVYGRNLSHGNGTNAAWVYVKPEGTAPGVWAAATDVTPYRVQFRVPPELAPGPYEVWAHNGHGGQFGWGGPVALTLGPPPPARTRIFNVQAYGARGNGTADDGPAIEAALAAASRAAPATLYFPAGTYLVRRAFQVPDNVRWQGAGRDASTLKVAPGALSKSGGPLLSNDGGQGGHGVEIQDLTLDGTDAVEILVRIRFTSGLRVQNARLRASPGYYLEIDGTSDTRIRNVEFTGAGGFLGKASQVSIADSRFLLSDNANSALGTWGGRELSITGNTIQDLNSASPRGTAAGRFFVSQAYNRGLRNLYIADNRTIALAPPAPGPGWSDFDQNAGEQILFEQCCASGIDAVAAAGPDSLTLQRRPQDPRADGSEDVMVVTGPGTGQYRTITGYDPATGALRIAPPWAVPPTTESQVIRVPVAAQAVITRNHLDGKPFYDSYDTASSGVQLYSNSADMVIDGNVITRMRGGIELWSMGDDKSKPTINATVFNLIVNNQVTDSYDGLVTYTMYLGGEAPGTIGLFGNVFRRNSGSRLTHAAIRMVTWPGYSGGAQSTNVFEHNRFDTIGAGLLSGPMGPRRRARDAVTQTALVDTILYDNLFDRGGASTSAPATARAMVPQPGTTWINLNNRWIGFAPDIPAR